MKRFLILLFSLFSIFTYGANGVNEAEVNKYIRQKLDRDKTITFTTKLTEPLTTDTLRVLESEVLKYYLVSFEYLVFKY